MLDEDSIHTSAKAHQLSKVPHTILQCGLTMIKLAEFSRKIRKGEIHLTVKSIIHSDGIKEETKAPSLSLEIKTNFLIMNMLPWTCNFDLAI